MEPQTDLPDLVEDLEVNIDELSEALQPLLSTPVHTTASSLPLLDKAKLYVLAAYSIESLLFSTLQASGVNAKEHAIFTELGRLKGYFAKVKEIEERGAQPKQRLDVGAAARFIKHGLAGNDKYDLERAERMAKERARAALKARQINKKFDEEDKVADEEAATPKKRGLDDAEAQEETPNSDNVADGLAEPGAEPATKKARVSAADLMDVDSAPSVADQLSDSRKSKRTTRTTEKNQGMEESNTKDKEDVAGDNSEDEAAAQSVIGKKDKKKKGSKKPRKSAENSSAEDSPSGRMPKTRSETFNALLDGSLAEKTKKGKGKGRGKGKAK